MQKFQKRLLDENDSIAHKSIDDNDSVAHKSVEDDESIKDAIDYGNYISNYYVALDSIEREKTSSIDNRPSWDDMFMQIAEVVAKRSKDPHTKVGAVIVKDNHILGIGYNAEPKNFSYNFNWNSNEKYDYVIHAELNAIANSTFFGNSIDGAAIYLTLSPCHECMKLLIQYGINVVYYKDEYKDFELSKKMAKYSKIKLIKYTPN